MPLSPHSPDSTLFLKSLNPEIYPIISAHSLPLESDTNNNNNNCHHNNNDNIQPKGQQQQQQQ